MKYPYANSLPGLQKIIDQLKSAFPPTLAPKNLQNWEIAKGNEKYILSVLTFLGIIDRDGNKVPEKAKVFLLSDDDFKSSFKALIQDAYSEVFQQFGDAAWTLPVEKLIPFFRNADQTIMTTLTVGRRQANTFVILSVICGVRVIETATKKLQVRNGSTRKISTKAKPEKPSSPNVSDSKDFPSSIPPISVESSSQKKGGGTMQSPNITVRIELNLPITNDQSVYDKLFKSIKENLLIDNV